VATRHPDHQNAEIQVETMRDPALDVAIEAVRDRASLVRICAQWEELVRHALEPHALHDAALTLALPEAPGEGGFLCCLSWARDPERSDLPATLGGAFLLRRGRSRWRFPAWTLHAALVRAEGAQRHLMALLDWLKRGGATVVEFRHVPREGRMDEVLAEVLRERDCAVYGCDVPAQGGVASPALRNLVVGLGGLGEKWVSMLPLLDRAKRRIAAASRAESPAVAA
jgi:hypothetical protein